MDDLSFWHEQINLIVGAIVAGVIGVITLFFKKLPNIITQKQRRTIILHDWTKANMINAIIQDLVDDIGCILGHVIQYHNHGPIKMTVLYEALGHHCFSCENPCDHKKKRRRLINEWQNRPILPAWLNKVALKTLEKNGLVNDILRTDMDEITQGIWEEANIHRFKECLIKVKSDGFITIGLSFCNNFEMSSVVDAKIMAAVNQLYKLS
jgi:hypothetical protein